jgi:hypothetical protein
LRFGVARGALRVWLRHAVLGWLVPVLLPAGELPTKFVPIPVVGLAALFDALRLAGNAGGNVVVR